MIHDKKHLKYTAIPNEEMYWERVNPSQEDKTITNNDTVSSALAKLKACAPGNAYVQINDNVFKVNSVSWSQTSKTKLKLKDGRLSFFLENAL